MDIVVNQIIWHPGLDYQPRTEGDYDKLVADVPIERVIELVQQRAKEDGEYCIANGLVGEDNASEPKMRRMMEWVSREKNIRQCLEHIDGERTVDWVCRDLAEATQVIGGSKFWKNGS